MGHIVNDDATPPTFPDKTYEINEVNLHIRRRIGPRTGDQPIVTLSWTYDASNGLQCVCGDPYLLPLLTDKELFTVAEKVVDMLRREYAGELEAFPVVENATTS